MNTAYQKSYDRAKMKTMGKLIVLNILNSKHELNMQLKKLVIGTSLVAQWLRIRLPMQGTRVRALVWEDPTCRGATKPVRHNY